jgi:hypothetical protein
VLRKRRESLNAFRSFFAEEEIGEHTWHALTWEANARVAMAAHDLTRAQDCIAKGLSAIEGFEVPLAALPLDPETISTR